MTRRSNVLNFARPSREVRSLDELRSIILEAWEAAKPLDEKRFTRVAGLMRELDPKAEHELFDLTPRELEARMYGKQGREPERYWENAALKFMEITRAGNSSRQARTVIVDELVEKHSITRPYAVRRLGEALKILAAKSANPQMFVRRDAD